ncbi:MAG: cation diffusion facilitator family transporter [Thaumarchaeota archaeon]|nr:cation diffusion facilitator family transporter [Nitrososphaerota archaeon]
MDAKKALTIALILSGAILVIELTGGLVFRSTALIADALHIVTDILAISFSFFALTISTRPPSGSSTYGYHRIEVVASLVNGLSLIGIVAIIMYTAYVRLMNPQAIDVIGTVSFASVALVLNIASSRVLSNAQSGFHEENEDLNVSSAELHILGDALASLAVIVGAIAIFFTGLHIIDPIVAVFIGLIILRSAVRITRQGGAIILEKSPIKNMQGLMETLQRVKGVSDVHDLHAWRICSHITVASLHACLDTSNKEEPMVVRKELERKLNESGVQHVTIQLEEVCWVPSHNHKD